MSRLEEVVERLERETLSLDDAVSLFEQGMGMARECERYLEEAHQKVSLLTSGGDLVPFAPNARESGEKQ